MLFRSICAFTVAWERPDAFRRVISFVGSFTNLRGGHNYPDFIRKMEPKPIRVYMQDGSNDQDIYSGSWFIGNNDVAAGLKFARYDYNYVVGTGTHSGTHAIAILPDALRWIWRDYPSPIKTPGSTPQPIMQVLQAGEEWQPADKMPEISPGKHEKALSAIRPACSVLTYNGDSYAAAAKDGRIWHIDSSGKRTQTSAIVLGVRGMTLSPDQTLLYVSSANPGKFVMCYQIQQNGSLDFGQPYFDMQFPYTSGSSGAAGMVVDTDGRLYVATTIGIQVCDQAGRVTGIIAGPEGKAVTGIAWGGIGHDVLFAISGGKVWTRKVKVKGALSSEAPVKPKAPQL